MDNQPAFDRSILIPIFISGCSVIGILIVLLVGRALNSPAEVPVTPSATRFQYVYIGTEPAINTPLVEETEFFPPEEEEPFPTDEPIEEPGDLPTPALMTPTRPGPLTPIILPSATGNTPVSPTVTSAAGPVLSPGIFYDDVHPSLVYNGWTATTSGGVTLHVSTVPGSTVSFRFIGTQVRLLYQGGNTLGQVRITIDNTVTDDLDQSNGTEWASDILSNTTHTVLITHVGGGSVNLDEIVIPAVATPTPTPTRTTNPGS
jgi:hypothetical protein